MFDLKLIKEQVLKDNFFLIELDQFDIPASCKWLEECNYSSIINFRGQYYSSWHVVFEKLNLVVTLNDNREAGELCTLQFELNDSQYVLNNSDF